MNLIKQLNRGMTFMALAYLGGCASVTPNARAELSADVPADELSQVIFYRRKNLQASLADAYISAHKDYFVQLGQNQYTQVSLPGGFYKFKVKAKGSVAGKHSMQIAPGETTCVRVRPNHEDLGLLSIPFLNALLPSFVLDEVQCPMNLQQYKKV